MTNETLPIDRIQVVDRHRRDLGDLTDLQASIKDIGLLHPVVVTSAGRLVAGQRRLEAYKRLGRAEVPVRIVETMDAAAELLQAEQDENTCRLDMLPSEKASLGLALEELERVKAKERQREGGRRGGQSEGVEKITTPSEKHGVREIVGAAVGLSGPTYQRARRVVAAADDGRPGAAEAVEEMDRTGNVTRAFESVFRTTHAAHETPNVPRPRQRQLAQAARGRVEKAVGTCNGLARGLDHLNVPYALTVTTDEEIDDWNNVFKEAVAAIHRLRKRLEGRG